jgi:hypothetical protein
VNGSQGATCLNCRLQNPIESKFCARCGKALDTSFFFSSSATVGAFFIAFFTGIALGFCTSVMVGQEIQRYITMHGIDAAIPLEYRLPITAGNLISGIIAGLVVGRRRMALNKKSAAGNVLIGLIAYTVVSIICLTALSAGQITHDVISFLEYVGIPILGSAVAYWSYEL